MFKIVRTYGDGSQRDFLLNLTATQATNYIARAVISGPTRGGIKGGTYSDAKVAM